MVEHKEILNKPFTLMEIENAIFQIGLDKAPRPDGLPALFYQQFWPTVKQDHLKMVTSFLNGLSSQKT